MMEEKQAVKVICEGGLTTNINHLELSEFEPGGAIELLNYENSLYGGYRRIGGFGPYDVDNPTVDPTNGEGRILLTAFLNDTLIVARKQVGSNTYKFYEHVGGATGWQPYTTGFTHVSTDVTTIRWDIFNFNGTDKIIFVDGVNPATVFDGTDWYQITTSGDGAAPATAGGDQTLNAPSLVRVFENHIFISGDPSAPNIMAHSAPLDDADWTAASGGGQIPVGFRVTQFYPFRDSNFVFGLNNIKRIDVDNTTFVLKDVTNRIGCVAPDSIVEIGGDLLFLSQDGFRPISATDRIGDVELETVSKKIQRLVSSRIRLSNMNELKSVLIRGKSQVRFFFSDPATETVDTPGIIGCLRGTREGNIVWDWGELLGIRASATVSQYIGTDEVTIHGDYNGKVYRQDSGNSFDGANIPAVYVTPFLDFGDTTVRKTIHSIRLFLLTEGDIGLTSRLIFNYGEGDKINPEAYSVVSLSQADLYDATDTTYGNAVYGDVPRPVVLQNTEGSGFSVQVKFTTDSVQPSYTIQGIVYEFAVNGRK